jgi:hypothetical protein
MAGAGWRKNKKGYMVNSEGKTARQVRAENQTASQSRKPATNTESQSSSQSWSSPLSRLINSMEKRTKEHKEEFKADLEKIKKVLPETNNVNKFSRNVPKKRSRSLRQVIDSLEGKKEPLVPKAEGTNNMRDFERATPKNRQKWQDKAKKAQEKAAIEITRSLLENQAVKDDVKNKKVKADLTALGLQQKGKQALNKYSLEPGDAEQNQVKKTGKPIGLSKAEKRKRSKNQISPFKRKKNRGE